MLKQRRVCGLLMDSKVIIVLDGQIDCLEEQWLNELIINVRRLPSGKTIILDCQEVTYIECGQLRQLLYLIAAISGNGHNCFFLPSEAISDLMSLWKIKITERIQSDVVCEAFVAN